MQPFIEHLESIASCVNIPLADRDWHTAANVPPEAGWYFIRTNTPIAVLQKQTLWSSTYVKKRNQQTAKVRNYDIAARAGRYADDLKDYWNTSEVYSGMASSLQARAREHTFADPGTAGLALARYPDLVKCDWLFGFVTLGRFTSKVSCPDMMLRLGEQLWRAKHGWPLLSAE